MASSQEQPAPTQTQSLSNVAEKHYQDLDVPKKIHILGTGSIGKLVAHGLAGIPDPPPLTLLLHRKTLIEELEQAENKITITTDGKDDSCGGYDAELALPGEDNGRRPSSNGEIIHNLIVTVKAPQTISAIAAIQHRLNANSTILFLQNGMGIVEEVNDKLFPDRDTRPNYMLGINSHGVYATSSFSAVHAGHGTVFLGLLPRIPLAEQSHDTPVVWPDSSRYLLRTLTRTPVLGAVALSPTDLLQAQIEKLAGNCVVNPLTVIIDSRNGDVLSNFALTRSMRLILAEFSQVVRALPELRGVPGIDARFSPERLEGVVVGLAEKTANNISSMLQDVRRGAKTEIEYINGYIVKRGEELGLQALCNYMTMQLVIGKQQMISREMDNYAPFSYPSKNK